MNITINQDLISRYNLPIPRYTSYPTVPVWKDSISREEWVNAFREQFSTHNGAEGISLYLHLPFCESLCTYCGCNKKITTNHSVEEEYLAALRREWQLYLAVMGERPIIRELHLGGGTPTFFSPANLAGLMDFLFNDSTIHYQHEFSIEGHPNNTTRKHLQTLFDLGFRRISYGVQDNDPEVQRIINRVQPLENVKRATDEARAIGFKSVNFDLIYGLPKQTLESLQRTLNQTLQLRPDRVAFYSYAHVPWTSRGQRLFDENDLPSPEEKMSLYLLGKKMFTEAGYVDIGMDHFALPADDLNIAREEGRLHRNFMGYTTQRTSILLGLGVSSISDAGTAFAQNEKALHDYYSSINQGELAVFRGYFLSEEDRSFRKYILDTSCKGVARFDSRDLALIKEYSFPVLEALKQDGLVNFDESGLEVTPLGRHFIRNICSAFDLYLRRSKAESSRPIFSKAI
jgi:oxygen-independent coproporphyrinogen-3 oxidase